MFDNVKREIQARLSTAWEQSQQMNTIYAYVHLILLSFPGFDDFDMNRRLRAMAGVANLVDPFVDAIDERRAIQSASEAIVHSRLPRLLCIALVSIVETALRDFAVIVLQDEHRDWAPDRVKKRVHALFYGGPQDYLPKLAKAFQFEYFLDSDWDVFRELTATRNMLVHKSDLIAHERYIRQAGSTARAKVGETLEVNGPYFTNSWLYVTACLNNLLSIIVGTGRKVF